MSDWRKLAFPDVVLINPTVKLDKGSVYPFVEMAALQPEGKFVYASEQRIFSTSGSRFADGDTLFARITPCLENGKIAMYRAVDKGSLAHGSTEFIIFRGKPSITTSEFIHYVATSPRVREFAIAKMTGTSGRQRVPTTAFEHLDVHVPNIETQQTITGLLCALDDKIDLNRRMNETLESIARALFKDWFVDFGPTRAKAEGQAPYLDPEIWELFPDTLDDDDKPVGWINSRLGDFVELVYGKALKADIRKPGSIPVYGSNGQVGWHNVNLADGPGVIVGRKGNPGTANYVIEDFFCIDTTFYAKPKSPHWTYSFLWLLMEQLNLPGLAADSAVPGLNREIAYSAECVAPKSEVAVAFSETVEPLLTRIAHNKKESETLAQLRDLLLPKLMSGEIRLCDAERAVEAVL